MLERNGSAVDAAIAALICNGLVNMQSMGFGGGFFMTVYIRKRKQAFVLNARDSAPLAAHTRMFDGKTIDDSRAGNIRKSKIHLKALSISFIYLHQYFLGGLSMTVPGELAGYWTAHQRFGKIPWRDLFVPTIDLCEKGYNLTKIQYEGLQMRRDKIFADQTLK